MNIQRQLTYLRDILERIERIEETAAPGEDAFHDSHTLQDAVIRSYEVIGEVVKRLDSSLTDRYPEIPWRQIAGFRDLLIHHYDRIDLDEVWRIVQQDTPVLKQAVEEMIVLLGDTD